MSVVYADVRAAFDRAADWFVDVVGSITDDQWDTPSLGEWTVRELVGHCGRAFSTVVRFVDEPATSVAVDDVGAYVRTAMALPDIHTSVAGRGREAGVALGGDPLGTVRGWRESATVALDGTTGAELGTTAVGGMRLDEYLRSRVVELVVHTVDISDAVGLAIPDLGSAGRVALEAIVAVPADRELQATVLRALLGRGSLPAGFNLLS